MFSKPYNVVVEGNIGCGKTTLLQRVAKLQGDAFEVLEEPVKSQKNGTNLAPLKDLQMNLREEAGLLPEECEPGF